MGGGWLQLLGEVMNQLGIAVILDLPEQVIQLAVLVELLLVQAGGGGGGDYCNDPGSDR
jgi:hypothetical protein